MNTTEDSFVLVPREPTNAMLNAIKTPFSESDYHAILAAARPWNWQPLVAQAIAQALWRLHLQVAAQPMREERLGGQRFKYVKLETVIGLITDAMGAECLTNPAAGWKIAPTQLAEELSIVPPMEQRDGYQVQPPGICVAAWSTTHESRVLYALAKSLMPFQGVSAECRECGGTGLKYFGRSSEEPPCEVCRGTGKSSGADSRPSLGTAIER